MMNSILLSALFAFANCSHILEATAQPQLPSIVLEMGTYLRRLYIDRGSSLAYNIEGATHVW